MTLKNLFQSHWANSNKTSLMKGFKLLQMKTHPSLKNKVWVVYSDPYVRLLVRSSVCPSQTLIRYSSKTAEQNFMKLLGTVHYMMPYCTSYFKILFE